MSNTEFFTIAAAYLLSAYQLQPDDIDLSVNSVHNRGESETPQEYIDYIANKYGLTKISNMTIASAAHIMRRFKPAN